MSQNRQETRAKTIARPAALAVVVVILLALAVWQIGPLGYTETNSSSTIVVDEDDGAPASDSAASPDTGTATGDAEEGQAEGDQE